MHPSIIEGGRTDLSHNPTSQTTGGNLTTQTTSVTNDLCYFGGIGLILTGLFMFFNHLKVGTGFLNMLGMAGGGFGLLLIPLMIGIGWLIYDPKSKIPGS